MKEYLSGLSRVEQGTFGAAEQAAEKVPSETKSVPQGLKPHCQQNSCGTAEAVPLSNTFLASV
jgi:hypothetical protein